MEKVNTKYIDPVSVKQVRMYFNKPYFKRGEYFNFNRGTWKVIERTSISLEHIFEYIVEPVDNNSAVFCDHD